MHKYVHNYRHLFSWTRVFFQSFLFKAVTFSVLYANYVPVKLLFTENRTDSSIELCIADMSTNYAAWTTLRSQALMTGLGITWPDWLASDSSLDPEQTPHLGRGSALAIQWPIRMHFMNLNQETFNCR